MSQYWIEFDVSHTEEWWDKFSAPNFGRDDLPCRELYEELQPFGIDPFFADEGDEAYDTNSLRVKAAKAACDRCPVQEACLEYALTANVPDGIWGGTTPSERRYVGYEFRKNRAKKGN